MSLARHNILRNLLELNVQIVLIDLFGELETSSGDQSVAKSLGIDGYGISMTTLEEVFLKLGRYSKK